MGNKHSLPHVETTYNRIDLHDYDVDGSIRLMKRYAYSHFSRKTTKIYVVEYEDVENKHYDGICVGFQQNDQQDVFFHHIKNVYTAKVKVNDVEIVREDGLFDHKSQNKTDASENMTVVIIKPTLIFNDQPITANSSHCLTFTGNYNLLSGEMNGTFTYHPYNGYGHKYEYWPEPDTSYTGTVNNNLIPHGKGTIVSAEYNYDGELFNGLPHGQGTMTTAQYTYTGTYKEGKMTIGDLIYMGENIFCKVTNGQIVPLPKN